MLLSPSEQLKLLVSTLRGGGGFKLGGICIFSGTTLTQCEVYRGLYKK